MRRILWPLAAVALALAWWFAQGCPRPGPGPVGPEVRDVVEPPPGEDATPPPGVDAPVPPPVEPLPPTALDPEGPRVADRRFQPKPGGTGTREGTVPTIVPTMVPDGDRAEPPELGPAALEAIRAQFGCGILDQLPWPASWLSPYGVVLRCCNQAAGRELDPDAFRAGCLMPFECSLLIDEGMGAISKLETVTALRQRLAPLRDPRSALAVVDATVRDVVPFFGDRTEDTALLLEGSWRYVAETITGTRVVERPGGGYDVTTFVVPGCGCRHDFVEVQFVVDELAGVTEQSRSVLVEDQSGLCVD
ncbi:MAG: hypothetical protein JXB32_22905 [Deltaproteobacteria bacterium]|nr:hypothetical protein [Deltaproteobacteria bacterium]